MPLKNDCARPARGLVLLALLIMLVLVGVGALGAAEVWSTTLKRERETELLFVGEQYRRAIQSYWKMSPGRRAYPPSIDVLLTDNRFPNPVHHLRRVYRDPMTESGEFEPILQSNALMGIHSVSTDAPIKQANFAAPYKQFEKAESYAQWLRLSAAGRADAGDDPGQRAPDQSGPGFRHAARPGTGRPAAAASSHRKVIP